MDVCKCLVLMLQNRIHLFLKFCVLKLAHSLPPPSVIFFTICSSWSTRLLASWACSASARRALISASCLRATFCCLTELSSKAFWSFLRPRRTLMPSAATRSKPPPRNFSLWFPTNFATSLANLPMSSPALAKSIFGNLIQFPIENLLYAIPR